MKRHVLLVGLFVASLTFSHLAYGQPPNSSETSFNQFAVEGLVEYYSRIPHGDDVLHLTNTEVGLAMPVRWATRQAISVQGFGVSRRNDDTGLSRSFRLEAKYKIYKHWRTDLPLQPFVGLNALVPIYLNSFESATTGRNSSANRHVGLGLYATPGLAYRLPWGYFQVSSPIYMVGGSVRSNLVSDPNLPVEPEREVSASFGYLGRGKGYAFRAQFAVGVFLHKHQPKN